MIYECGQLVDSTRLSHQPTKAGVREQSRRETLTCW